MSERSDDTSVNNSPPDALKHRDDTKPSSGEDTSLTDRKPAPGDDALAGDDLPKEERIDHQNDLA